MTSTTLNLVPMTPAEYDVWVEQAISVYAEEFLSSGIMNDPEAARARSVREFGELLPEGMESPDNLFCSGHVADETEPVGTIWIKVNRDRSPLHAFVYALDVDERHRRRGYGRAIMEAAIEDCRKLGVKRLGLNVFGHNEGARRLYDQLGFTVTSTSMQLEL